MSVTKLRTEGTWQVVPRPHGAVTERRTKLRGRVIIGMLTGGDACPDVVAVAPEQREERTR
jgi:hypothetical protein